MGLRLGTALAVLLAGECGLAQSWNSQLFPKINGKYTAQIVSFAGKSWALDDFRKGIYLVYSARITVLDCVVIGAQDKNGGGWGYGYEVEDSQNVLITRCGESRRGTTSSRPAR